MNRFASLARNPLLISAAAILALLAIGEAVSPGFARGDQIVRLLTVAAILGIAAAGQNLVILGGREGIDLSIGAVISLGAVIAGNVMNGADAAIPLAFAGAAGVGFVIGVVNGLGVTWLRIPPLVMTLGMMGVIQGGLVVLSRGVPSGNAAPALMAFVNRSAFLGIPGILFVWAGLAGLMALVLNKTRFGWSIYAIGANETAAVLTGLPARRIRVLLYGLAGLCGGLTGVCVIGYTGNSFISVGDQYVLPSVIAVVIGGTSLAGGAGSYTGTALGAIALVLLQSVLTTLNLEYWGRQVIFGVTLLLLMLLYGRQSRLRV
jgi:ribose transport system permease protein